MTITIPAGKEARNLFVSETFYPGWSAYSEGETREVTTGGRGTFMNVELSGADREVRLVFEPAPVRVGCFLALIGIAMAAAVITAGRRTGRDI
jgi:uncharacterized membrane protein YfhO